MIVIDASMIGAMVLDESPPAAITDQLMAAQLVAPAHWPTEVANMILTAERRRRIAEPDRRYLFDRIGAMRVAVRRGDEGFVWDRALSLATEHRLTIYDAAYLELAIRLGYDLATLDGELQRAAGEHGVTVITWLAG